MAYFNSTTTPALNTVNGTLNGAPVPQSFLVELFPCTMAILTECTDMSDAEIAEAREHVEYMNYIAGKTISPRIINDPKLYALAVECECLDRRKAVKVTIEEIAAALATKH